jgi:hypothetical protein
VTIQVGSVFCRYGHGVSTLKSQYIYCHVLVGSDYKRDSEILPDLLPSLPSFECPSKAGGRTLVGAEYGYRKGSAAAVLNTVLASARTQTTN